jgi:hypothetical protein
VCFTYILGCGSGGGGGGDGTSGGADGGGGGPGSDGGSIPIDDLESPTGCDGPFNPSQVLEYHITTGGDFPGLEDDDYMAGTFACGDEEPMRVGIKTRHLGEGWMVDVNWAVQGQSFRTLNKVSFHTGASGEGVTEEYLSWRVQRLAGARFIQRSALAHVWVDGDDKGILFNLEQIDKRFLRSRLGDDSGWLYKKSGIDDGYRTNETMPNPYEADWCFFEESQPCNPPADLETWLPDHLALDQMLTWGAANAMIGNSDGPLSKPHNFYSYDYAGGPRYYWPWDLDSTQQSIDPFDGPGDSIYESVMFPTFHDRYADLIAALLEGPLAVAAVSDEIDLAVATGDGAVNSGAASSFKSFYKDQHAALSSQVGAR